MQGLIILACLAIALSQLKGDNHGIGNQSQQNAQTSQNKSDPRSPSQSSTKSTDQKPAGDTDKNHSQPVSVTSFPKITVKPDEDWVMVICTIILTGVGIVGTCAAIKTLRQIRRQADTLDEHKTKFEQLATATGNNAQAAVDNVKALRETERAWVVETIRFTDDGKVPRRPPYGGGILIAILALKNIGKQPAFLKVLQTRFHAIERLAEAQEFKTIPTVFPDGFMLAPGETHYFRVVLEEGSFDDDQVHRIERHLPTLLYLYIYGILVYDTIGIRGINRFCYTWNPMLGFNLEGDKPRFDKDGPKGYNQHT